MISVQKVIFPGLIAGCLFVLLVTSLIASPKVALADSPAIVQVTPTIPLQAAQRNGANLTLPMISAQAPQEAAPREVAAAQEVAAQEVAVAQEVPAPTATPPVEQTTEQNPPAPAEQPAAEEPAAPSEDQSCSISPSFPDAVRQWCGLIHSHAGKHGLDENLVAALILQESGGNARAYSRNGAVGLMQVMPRDGLAAGFACINGPCFASRPSSEELYDPEFNISYGTRMLAGLIQKYGDVREALRAYGPSNMGYRYADIVLSLMQRYR